MCWLWCKKSSFPQTDFSQFLGSGSCFRICTLLDATMLDNGIVIPYFALPTNIKLSLLKTHTRQPKDIFHLDHNTKADIKKKISKMPKLVSPFA